MAVTQSSTPAENRPAVDRRFLIGAFAVFTFILMSAVKTVYVSSIVHGIDPILLVLCTFVFAAAYFLVHCLVTGRISAPWRISIGALFGLNVTTLMAWVTFYYALKHLEPSVVSCLVTAIGPVVVIFVDRLFRRKERIHAIDLTLGTAILVTTVVLAWATLTGRTGISVLQSDPQSILLGLIGSVISGFGLTGNTVFTKKLFDHGWRPAQIMAHRFYLLILFAGLYVMVVLPEAEQGLWMAYIPSILFVATIGVLIPLFVLQYGIQRCTPIAVSTILAMGPVLTFTMQMLESRIPASGWTVAGVALITVFVVANVFVQARRSGR